MPIQIYQVDAFAPAPLGGNPAAVALLDEPLDDGRMHDIALELNLPMTAFVSPANGEGARPLRWFYERGESDFCGHATFATGHVLLNELDGTAESVHFETKAGRLSVERRDEGCLAMTVPALPIEEHTEPRLVGALGREPVEVYHSEHDILAVLDTAHDVETVRPNARVLRKIEARGVVVTSSAGDFGDGRYDFVSRFLGTLPEGYEDAATGSAHAMLTPYWAKRFERTESLYAAQLSERGGEFLCDLLEDGKKVRLTSQAFTFAMGTLTVSGDF